MPDSKSKPNWFWPTVTTRDEARIAAKQGVWAAGFVAVVTSLVAAYAGATGNAVMGIDAWAFLDAAIFAGIAIGIYRMSRIASVVGLVLYIAERLFMMATSQGAGGIVVVIFLTIAFLNSVRGTFAFHKMAPQAPAVPSIPPPIG